MVDSSPPSELNIQLGDILEFNAPEDEKLDRQNFLVNYIDNNILVRFLCNVIRTVLF